MGALRFDRALEVLKRGAIVNRVLPSPLKTGEPERYEIMPQGGYITKNTFERLLADLVPVSEGLFADLPAQSYRLKGVD